MTLLRERADFTYGNTRLRARRAGLLGARELAMLPTSSIGDLLAALDTTPYGPDLDAAAGAGLDRLHAAAAAHLTSALTDTVSLYEGVAARVVRILLARWDGPNLVTVLRCTGRRALPPMVAVGSLDRAAAHEAAAQPTTPDAAALLLAWGIPGPHTARALRAAGLHDPVAAFEAPVVAAAAADLDDAIAAAGEDATPIAAMIAIERDATGIVHALRLHDAIATAELALNAIPSLLADVPAGRIDRAALAAAATAVGRPAATAVLEPRLPERWRPALRRWADGTPTSRTQRDLDDLATTEVTAGFATGDPLSAAIPAAWVASKEHEARRLRQLGAVAAGAR